MDLASILYLGVTFGLFVVFALIVLRTYSKKRRKEGEIAKYRMLEDDD
ncbi:MAG TPA: CcoQ/FixQ family Cbb3-type cytochrome c oxidase assembly chaperone [Desulfobulbus sp.]|nr:CcoQ/FixQ family Cbb3-type cytochrome c oxidase assembly chaperone [Desulfobulbus sp.]